MPHADYIRRLQENVEKNVQKQRELENQENEYDSQLHDLHLQVQSLQNEVSNKASEFGLGNYGTSAYELQEKLKALYSQKQQLVLGLKDTGKQSRIANYNNEKQKDRV